MSVVFPILVFVAVIALVGAIAYFAHLGEKKRTEDLKQAAHDLGFEFDPEGNAAFLQSLERFQLFSQGHTKKLWNLMRGESHNLEVAIFDYRYVTGSGKHRHTWNHSVICFTFDGPGLPTFSLRPESIWHKIGSWFGHQDIDFDSHPSFSRSYLLRGDDEDAIRQLFADTVLEFYEQRPGLSTEGSGNTLLYYRHAVRVDPQAIRPFMEDGFRVLSLYYSKV